MGYNPLDEIKLYLKMSPSYIFVGAGAKFFWKKIIRNSQPFPGVGPVTGDFVFSVLSDFLILILLITLFFFSWSVGWQDYGALYPLLYTSEFKKNNKDRIRHDQILDYNQQFLSPINCERKVSEIDLRERAGRPTVSFSIKGTKTVSITGGYSTPCYESAVTNVQAIGRMESDTSGPGAPRTEALGGPGQGYRKEHHGLQLHLCHRRRSPFWN